MSRPISPELVLSPDFRISNIPRYFSFAFEKEECTLNEKGSSQEMYMWNMKASPETVQKLWQRLKFFDMKVKGHREGH